MKKAPETFLRARLIAVFLLSLAAVTGSQIAWEPQKGFSPLSLLWPPLALGTAAVLGVLLQERLAGLMERQARNRVRSLVVIVYGALLLAVSLGLLSGSRDAARDGCSILRGLQVLFLLLAGFGRGHLGTLINAFALTSTSLLAGGLGAALSATLQGSLLVFFLTADHAARTLTEFPVEDLPPPGRILARGAAAATLIAGFLVAFFWLLPPARYAPLERAGAIPTLPSGQLVGLLSNLLLVAVVSTVAFYFLLRFGYGGRSIASEEPVVDIVAAQRKAARPEGARYREPAAPVNPWRVRIVALYLETSKQLAKWGRRRRPSQTPREFARSLAPAAAAAELADLFGRARYGPADLTEADFEQASRVSREILDRQRRRS